MTTEGSGKDHVGYSGERFTRRELEFVEAFVLHGNKTKAYRDAGFLTEGKDDKHVGSKAYRLINKPRIQKEIQIRMDERAARTNIDADYVLKTIKNTIERCSQAVPVIKGNRPVMIDTPDGRIAPAYTFDATGVLKGCELLGKHLKLFADRIEVDGSIQVKVVKKRFDGKLNDADD